MNLEEHEVRIALLETLVEKQSEAFLAQARFNRCTSLGLVSLKNDTAGVLRLLSRPSVVENEAVRRLFKDHAARIERAVEKLEHELTLIQDPSTPPTVPPYGPDVPPSASAGA